MQVILFNILINKQRKRSRVSRFCVWTNIKKTLRSLPRKDYCVNKSKEDSLLSSPPFGSSHNSFQSRQKIYEVKFSFLYNVHHNLALRENNRNVVVVVEGNNVKQWNVEKEKGIWESGKAFFLVEMASVASYS